MSGAAAPWPPIGVRVPPSRAAGASAAIVGLAVVARDLVAASEPEPWLVRAAPAAAAVLVLLLLARGRRSSLGLVLRPAPSSWWWVKATAAVAVGMALFFAAATTAWIAFGGAVHLVPLFRTREEIGPWLVHACVFTPVVEELIYRLVLSAPLVTWLGRWGTIAVGGTVFAFLHFRYGTPGLDNAVAGFVLTWAYLRSGCLWVPIVLHALGNLGVAVFHLGLLEGWIPRP